MVLHLGVFAHLPGVVGASLWWGILVGHPGVVGASRCCRGIHNGHLGVVEASRCGRGRAWSDWACAAEKNNRRLYLLR